MTSHSLRRTLTVFVLLACLAFAAVPAQAAPLGPVHAATDEGMLLNLWGFLAGLLDKAGMSIDPDGKPEGDEGMSIDPNGDNPDSGEAGMTIDPNG